MSNEYKQAIRDNDRAMREYRAAQVAYRARLIDDAAFIQARQAYMKAINDFDEAYRRESSLVSDGSEG